MESLSSNGIVQNPEYSGILNNKLYFGAKGDLHNQNIFEEGLIDTLRQLPEFNDYENLDDNRLNYAKKLAKEKYGKDVSSIGDFGDIDDAEIKNLYNYYVSKGMSDKTTLNSAKMRLWEDNKNFSSVPTELEGLYSGAPEGMDLNLRRGETLTSKLTKDLGEITLNQLKDHPEIADRMRSIGRINARQTDRKLMDYLMDASLYSGIAAVGVLGIGVATGGAALPVVAGGLAVLSRASAIFGGLAVGVNAYDRYQAGVSTTKNFEATALEGLFMGVPLFKGEAILGKLGLQTKNIWHSIRNSAIAGGVFGGLFSIGEELADHVAFGKEIDKSKIATSTMIGASLAGTLGGLVYAFVGKNHTFDLFHREIADDWLKSKNLGGYVTEMDRNEVLGKSLSTIDDINDFFKFASQEKYQGKTIVNRALDRYSNDTHFTKVIEHEYQGTEGTITEEQRKINKNLTKKVIDHLDRKTQAYLTAVDPERKIKRALNDFISPFSEGGKKNQALNALGRKHYEAEEIAESIVRAYDRENVKDGSTFTKFARNELNVKGFNPLSENVLPNLSVRVNNFTKDVGSDKIHAENILNSLTNINDWFNNKGLKNPIDILMNKSQMQKMIGEYRKGGRGVGLYSTLSQDNRKVMYKIIGKDPKVLDLLIEADRETNNGKLFDRMSGASKNEDIYRDNISSRAREVGRFKSYSDASTVTHQDLLDSSERWTVEKLMSKVSKTKEVLDENFIKKISKETNLEKLEFAYKYGFLNKLTKVEMKKYINMSLTKIPKNSEKIVTRQRIINHLKDGNNDIEGELSELLNNIVSNKNLESIDQLPDAGRKATMISKLFSLLGSPMVNLVEGLSNHAMENLKGQWFKFTEAGKYDLDHPLTKDILNHMDKEGVLDVTDFNHTQILTKGKEPVYNSLRNLGRYLTKYLIDEFYSFGDRIGRYAKRKYIFDLMSTTKDAKSILRDGGAVTQRYGLDKTTQILETLNPHLENGDIAGITNEIKNNPQLRLVLKDTITSNNMTKNFAGDMYVLKKFLAGKSGIEKFLIEQLMPFARYAVSNMHSYINDLRHNSQMIYKLGDEIPNTGLKLSPINRRLLKAITIGVMVDLYKNLTMPNDDPRKKTFNSEGYIGTIKDSVIKEMKNITGAKIIEDSVVGHKSLVLNNLEKVGRASQLVLDDGLNWKALGSIVGEIYSPITTLFNFVPLKENPFGNVQSYKKRKEDQRKARRDDIKKRKKQGEKFDLGGVTE